MSATRVLKGLGGFVMYYPALAKHVGGVKPAIMLCQLVYWADKTDCQLGVYKSVDEWEQETGLSYREQITARKELSVRGLVIETTKRLEHRIYFLLNEDRLDEILEEIGKTSRRFSRNAESAYGGEAKPQFVHTETTTEKNPSVAHQDGRPSNDEILNAYQEVCGGVFKGAEVMTPKREANVKKLMSMTIRGKRPFRDKGVEFWKAFFNDCLTNPHWRGGNDRGWKADFEFITRPENVAKVLGV